MNLFRSEEHVERWLEGRSPGATIPVSTLARLAVAWWSDRLSTQWRPRTRAALAAARERGAHVIVVTGRMFQAVRRYLTGPEPVVCYQGAVVADPETGKFLRHVPIPLELAREGIEAIQIAGYGLNCYVDDEIYVARLTPEAAQYAGMPDGTEAKTASAASAAPARR